MVEKPSRFPVARISPVGYPLGMFENLVKKAAGKLLVLNLLPLSVVVSLILWRFWTPKRFFAAILGSSAVGFVMGQFLFDPRVGLGAAWVLGMSAALIHRILAARSDAEDF